MSTIIRASEHNRETQGVAFNYDDMTLQANGYLAKVRSEALKIVVQAQREAEAVRKRAETEGRQAAIQAVEQMVRKELDTVLPGLKKAIQDIVDARHNWLAHWETSAVHVAVEIARRVIRRELSQQPDIPLALVREALELSAGNSQLRILLNPRDLQSLGDQVRALVNEMSPLIDTDIAADAEITPGGCRVETRFGAIDQQFEAQLARIEEELKAE
jgi:flagellar assembly protein FliH